MKEELNKIKKSTIKNLRIFLRFLQKDSLASIVVFLLLAIVFLVGIFFPTLSFLTGSDFPLVIVESCSMYHEEYGFDEILNHKLYTNNNITIEDTKEWDFHNGLKKGDIIFIVAPKNIEKGDVVIFNAGGSVTKPIIHRIIDNEEPYATKGDNNGGQVTYQTITGQTINIEDNISGEQLLGKAVFRIPALGWIKLIFFDFSKDNRGRRGFCSNPY